MHDSRKKILNVEVGKSHCCKAHLLDCYLAYDKSIEGIANIIWHICYIIVLLHI